MPRFTPEALEALALQALAQAGANDDMARTTARALVYADARGLPSHGVARVLQYAKHLQNGRADGTARPEIVAQKPAALLVDAHCGLAFPACALAVHEAVERART